MNVYVFLYRELKLQQSSCREAERKLAHDINVIKIKNLIFLKMVFISTKYRSMILSIFYNFDIHCNYHYPETDRTKISTI